MKRIVLLIALVVPFILQAQEFSRIKGDPNFLWAEGRGSSLSEADANALDALIEKLSRTDFLPIDESIRQEMWKTYRTDVLTGSKSVHEGNYVLRYIPWSGIQSLFSSRRKRVAELVDYAAKASPDVARTYLGWAEIYLRSLPPEKEITVKIARLREQIGPGQASEVRMLHIRKEVDAIAAISGGKNLPGTAPPSKEARREQELVSGPDSEPVSSPWPKGSVSPVPRPQFPPMGKASALSVCSPVSPLQHGFSPGPPQLSAPHASLSKLCFIAQAASYYGMDAMPALGVMVGWRGDRIGAYASVRSNFKSIIADYPCKKDGTTDFGYIWTDGDASVSLRSASAGGLLRIAPCLDLMFGGGYGESSTFWKDNQGRWARVEDISAKGLLLETGLVFSIGRIAIQAGCSAISFQKACPFVGIGVNL